MVASSCSYFRLFTGIIVGGVLTIFFPAAANEIPSKPLPLVREQVTNLCINALFSYRKFCATVSSSGQLILPEALKLLPLYTLGMYEFPCIAGFF